VKLAAAGYARDGAKNRHLEAGDKGFEMAGAI
jgi:hypothetical protein